jgi:dTDP-4-amino-4,6-dideoxy-D-galactose acyltransferase
VEALTAIARTIHHDTRFYFDRHFAVAQVDALYATWIEKSCTGFADIVWVCEQAGRPVGYVTCTLTGQGLGHIGLFGVHPQWQGRGIGTALIAQALTWFASRLVTEARVVTQGRNIPALCLYQRSGFSVNTMQLWYHRWFTFGSTGSLE